MAQFRHEWKHEIDPGDCAALRARLRAVCRPDPHAPEGRYFIRSLYFDTPSDRALREKIDGVDRREKFRLRCYDLDFSLIRLEKKSKWNGLGNKQQASLTAAQAQRIVDGELDWMAGSGDPLIQELYCKMRTLLLRPRTIVDYDREAFVFPAGNVRVTLDSNIRTGLAAAGFLDPGCVTVPAGDAGTILEVKWDGFLPDIIRDAVQLESRRAGAFSKYTQCRIYG